MKLNEHPDFQQYKNVIDELTKSIQEQPCENQKLISSQEFPILPEKYFIAIHRENSHLIGKKIGRLSLLGFAKPETNAAGAIRFSCKCNCGMYCIISAKKAKNADNVTPISCPKCHDKLSKFDKAFIEKTGKALSLEALHAILFPELNISIDNLMRHVDLGKLKELQEKRLKELTRLSIDDLKWLLLPNSKLNTQFFRFSEEENKVYKKDSPQNLASCRLKPSEMINLNTTKDVPYSFKNTIGRKIFRLTVIGITTNNKELRTRYLTYICKCDCGLYVDVSHETLKPTRLPACGRCNVVVQLLIRKEKVVNSNTISIEQAWELLGQNTEIVPIQIEDLKALKSNSYETPRKVYERETSFDKFQATFDKRYGMVTAIAKSRRIRTEDSYYQIACKCDCGNECVFPYDTLKNQKNPYFLACSVCTTIIQSSTHINISLERTDGFTKKWKDYLEYHEVHENVSFVEVYNHFLKMRFENPNLIFNHYLTKLFDYLKNKPKRV